MSAPDPSRTFMEFQNSLLARQEEKGLAKERLLASKFGQFEHYICLSRKETVRLSRRILNSKKSKKAAAVIDREMVWDKTGGMCWYCGVHLIPQLGFDETFHVEHVIPHSRNGTNDLSNVVPSCRKCNYTKRDLALADFRVLMTFKMAGSPYFNKEQRDWLMAAYSPSLYTFYFEMRDEGV